MQKKEYFMQETQRHALHVHKMQMKLRGIYLIVSAQCTYRVRNLTL